MKSCRRFVFLMIATATLGLVAPCASMADLYFVQRAWSNATLTGTVELPMGNYTIMNSSPAPFTAIHLTLSVNGNPIALFTNANTGLIQGAGQFFINASTTLTFSTAHGSGTDPADFEFENAGTFDLPRYVIGTDTNPGFQVAYYPGGGPIASVTFPTVFGILIPEPSAVTLGAVGAATLMIVRRRCR
jgi:hypothetical protein